MTYALIIPTFHHAEALLLRLITLREQTVDPRVVLVVDNSGDAATSEVISEAASPSRWPIRHVRSMENLGPAGGTSLGMRVAIEEHPELRCIGRGDDDGPQLPSDHFAVPLTTAQSLRDAGHSVGASVPLEPAGTHAVPGS